jgi:hypothetical protein
MKQRGVLLGCEGCGKRHTRARGDETRGGVASGLRRMWAYVGQGIHHRGRMTETGERAERGKVGVGG